MTENIPREDASTGAWSSAVRHYRRGIIATTLVVAVLALAYASLRGHSYTSSATLQIRPLVGNAFSPDVAANDQNTAVALQTEANLVDSLPVTRLVNKNTHSSLTPASASVTGTVPINTTLITISYTAASPSNARRLATAYANAFLAYRAGQAQGIKSAELRSLSNQEKKIEQLLTQATKTAQQQNPPPGASVAQDHYATKLATVQSQLSDTAAMDTHPGSVVVPANKPKSGATLTTIGFAIAGAIVGFLASAAFALWRYRRRDEISSRHVYGSVCGLPLLAVLPVPHARDHRTKPGDADSIFDDAVRRARVGLLASVPSPAVLAVCPVSEDESVTGITVELARSLAAAQYSVVVVDASLAQMSVAERIGLPEPRNGLSDALLADPANARSLLVHAKGIHVLPGGHDPLGARERLSSSAFGRLVHEIAQDADYVLIAARSPLTGDGSSVLRVARSTLLVATDERTTHEQVSAAAETSARFEVPVLGVLIRTLPRRPQRPRPSGTVSPAAPERPGAAQGAQAPTAAAEKEAAYATRKPASSGGGS